eukprot:36567-Prorocentrum_minimum.AAC.1
MEGWCVTKGAGGIAFATCRRMMTTLMVRRRGGVARRFPPYTPPLQTPSPLTPHLPPPPPARARAAWPPRPAAWQVPPRPID